MNLKFRFRMRASETTIEVVPAVLAESHPALRRLRSHLHESAARTGRGADEAARLADQAFAGFVARCMHTFGEAYLERITTAVDRIYRGRVNIAEQLNRILRGEAADFAAITRAYADIDAVMPDIVAPDAATPPAISASLATGPEAPAASGSAGTRTRGSSRAGRAPRAEVPVDSGEPLLHARGDPTDAGIARIRREFRWLHDGARWIALSELSDAQLRDFFPNQSSWHENLVLAELGTSWEGRTGAIDFAMTNSQQSLRAVVGRLAESVAAGRTGHTVRPEVLELPALEFVRQRVAARDPVLTPAFEFLERHPNRAVRARWREFQFAEKRGDMSGFMLGKVGDKRPDAVEVVLSRNTIHVLDATFASGDPIHNFKTAFYRCVLESVIDVGTVTGVDYRAASRQTPVGQ